MGTSAPPPEVPDHASVLEALSPVPVAARLEGGSAVTVSVVRETVRVGDPEWAQLADLDPAGLRAEGYALRIRAADGVGEALLAAPDEVGLFRARTTLAALQAGTPELPALSIRDEPALPWRGTIEGFYGEPWSHEERLEHLRFCARNKMNSFAYAPKDEPYHRERWREPYPDAQLAQLAELVRAARDNHVRFTYTIAPGLSMVYSSPDERALLFAKADQLWQVGVRSFALLFDDIPPELRHPEDQETFGAGAGAAGAAHGRVCAEFQEGFLRPRGGDRLVMVPTEYSGVERSPYRSRLAQTLPRDALVWWTGSDVVVGAITREDIDRAAAAFDRDLLLWDNFPVNDFDPTRLFLGPLRGRATDIEGSRLVGVNANPMVQAAASQFALATVADWAWNPSAYDPEKSAERSVRAVAGSLASALRPLLAVTSAWPPGRDPAPHLSAAIPSALRGDAAALTRLQEALAELAALPAALEGRDEPLVVELRPWLDAAGREAAIALDATELLAAGGPVSGERRGRLLRELDAAAGDAHDVLRSTLDAYTRSVLDRLP